MASVIGIQEVSLEKAYDMVGELESVENGIFDSAQVFRGLHPILGEVYIVIQAFGGALILPFASHST